MLQRPVGSSCACSMPRDVTHGLPHVLSVPHDHSGHAYAIPQPAGCSPRRQRFEVNSARQLRRCCCLLERTVVGCWQHALFACPAGRWKASLVAVKVIEHSSSAEGPGSSRGNGASAGREMMFATSISHPTLVSTTGGWATQADGAWSARNEPMLTEPFSRSPAVHLRP